MSDNHFGHITPKKLWCLDFCIKMQDVLYNTAQEKPGKYRFIVHIRPLRVLKIQAPCLVALLKTSH